MATESIPRHLRRRFKGQSPGAMHSAMYRIRRVLNLCQTDVARELGFKYAAAVSRYERLNSVPQNHLAYEAFVRLARRALDRLEPLFADLFSEGAFSEAQAVREDINVIRKAME